MKFSKYNIVIEKDYGLLVYNVRHANVVQIHNEAEVNKFRNILKTDQFNKEDDMVKALYQKGFIIEDTVDEYEETKNEIKMLCDNNGKILNLMLYVTLNCNFRCDYCFEKHVNKKLSKKLWDAIYKYIKKSLEKGIYECIKIDFFGGEPLLELNSILNFLDKLEELKKEFPKVAFYHSMVTNGYLLTPNVYDELVKRDILAYQVTVDGFADAHNVTRPLVGGGETWDRIIENLKYINTKDDQVRVNVRININKLNVKTVNKFIDWIKQNFNMQKFGITPTLAEKCSDETNDTYLITDDSQNVRTTFADVEKSLGSGPLRKLEFACKCSAKGYYAISVDGKIGKCDKFHDKTCIFGKVSEDGDFVLPYDMEQWDNKWETEYCKDCIQYPLCAGRNCPEKRMFSSPKKRLDCRYMRSNPPSDVGIREMLSNWIAIKFPNVRNKK